MIVIDNREIEIPAGRRLNGIEAARLAGIEIPHYCWHPGLSVVGSCRMCLVEVGSRDPKTGKITMQPKLAPACNLSMTDGMVLVTNSEKVARARAMVEEGLLLRHPIDCPICDKAGECMLAGLSFPVRPRRAPGRHSSLHQPPPRPWRRDAVRRSLRDVQPLRALHGRNQRHQRADGHRPQRRRRDRRRSRLSLAQQALRQRGRSLPGRGPWATRTFCIGSGSGSCGGMRAICTGCATGCSIWIEENQDRIYRIKPRENPLVNKWWICNDGRYGYPHVHNPAPADAAAAPRRRNLDRSWIGPALPGELHGAVAAGGAAGRGRFAVSDRGRGLPAVQVHPRHRQPSVVGPGPVPVVGEDERFPKGFTICAEKCPNRRGVEAVIAHFAQRVTTFDELLPKLGSRRRAGRMGVGRLQERLDRRADRPGDSSG